MSQLDKILFGGLSATQFMQRHWQKKPLLVRGAFPQFSKTLEPFSPKEVMALARNPDAESRLVTRQGSKWTLQHGPFKAADLRRLGPRNWTVLVQDTQHFSQRAESLLARFAFLPHVRVDDLMVSLASPGGGVGPHVDSYDVFLIQGHGRRRWRISGQADTEFRAGLPLRILRNFRPHEEWVLESGDMLYLPPGHAHEGVALDECLTYSVGFRAPTHQEWIESFLDQLRDQVRADGQYADPGLRPTIRPGEIPASMIGRLGDVLNSTRWSKQDVARAAGRFLTEPKSHVMFDAPEQTMNLADFKRACATRGLRLDGRTRMAYHGDDLFINGEAVTLHSARDSHLKQLADQRALPPFMPDKLELRLLHDWHEDGYIHVCAG